MKKFIYFLAVLLTLTTAAVTFCACDDDDENGQFNQELCYFTIGVGTDTLKFEGDKESEKQIVEYMETVEKAIYHALGTTDGLIFNGDYSKHAADLIVIFNNAELPAPPQTSARYSFTYHLYGTNKIVDGMTLKDMQILASRSFVSYVLPIKPGNPDTPLIQK